MFLLKGHEDLRQDERVMQLFGLADPNTYRHDLAIQRYAVIPLSPNSGLIGWVPQCDTLYNLISDYREKKSNKMSLNTEQQIMLRNASDYQKLMLKHKVTGIEGTYRFTCESVMHVLHKHRDSVMAVLEAFVYDPLLNWRLVDNEHRSITESTFSSDINSSYTMPSRSRNHLHYESVEIPPEANLNKRA
ncbi:Uncharacterized protein OBRU01_21832, partial [Operophtera brumata]